MPHLGPSARGHLAMLLFSALVAGSFSLGSLVARDIAPAAFNAARFLIAGVVLGIWALSATGVPRRSFVAPWRYLVLGGLFAIYFVMMFAGLRTAMPVSMSAVFTLMPVMSAGFGYLLLRQITTWRIAAGLTIGAGGALWVIFGADLAALRSFRIGHGEALFFWGCAAHALYTPMVRKLHRGEPAVVFSFGTLVAALAVLVIYGWHDILATDWLELPRMVWITLAYTSLAASAITFVLLQYAALRLPASKVMAYTYLTPSWVILWEISLGHGAPRALVMGGVVLSVLALLILLRDEH